MPIFTVKKTRKAPDQGQEEEQVEEINVPNEIFTKIMMMLDGLSLHTSRQVSKEWNSVIKAQVLDTVQGRREMERTLQHQWREAAPARPEFTIGGSAKVLYVTDQFAVICYALPSPEMFKISVVNIREGVELMELFCGEDFPRPLINKDVLLLVQRLDGKLEVLAWNIRTSLKIFNKTFPAGVVEFDEHNKQVMVGRNTRLEIIGNTIIETIQPPLPGDSFLWAFSDPDYLTRGPGGGTGTLWKVEETEVTRVGPLGAAGWEYPVFCPARDLIVSCSPRYSDLIKLKVFSSQSGQLIKERLLTAPTAFYGLQRFKVSDNQLVMNIIQESDDQTVLLVYQLDTLLSQSADHQISPRMFELGQSGSFTTIHLNKTSVSAAVEMGDKVKFLTLDFWNTEN